MKRSRIKSKSPKSKSRKSKIKFSPVKKCSKSYRTVYYKSNTGSRMFCKKKKSKKSKKTSRKLLRLVSYSPRTPRKSFRSKSNSRSRSSLNRSRRRSQIQLKKGELVFYGYHAKDTQEKRRNALKKAIKEYGSLPVFRKLNVLYVFQKNKHPSLSNRFLSDRKWVKENFYY